MKQVFQDGRTAEITIEEVPAPKLLAGCVLVRTAVSLVSAGTERASLEFAGKNLFQKARTRPDLVREVLNKINRDGFAAALSAMRTRLDQPSALGYSSSGNVVAIGEAVTGFNVGDRVACAGAGHAVHAEFACIPRLLVARIPSESVSFDDAAFTTLGAVALHGIRNAEAKLGDIVAVIGLGLLGQLTVQILKAAGCSVLGMDISRERSELALRSGADAVSTSSSEFHDSCLQFSSGHGVDAVLITAQSPSNDPVNLAAAIARSRAAVVAVGTVAMDIPRRDFYEKELHFRVSRSYGPGRYDSSYEQNGIDYPIGYVRWTETRNMEAFLKLLADRKLNLQSLITHRFPIAQAHSAYDLITARTQEPSLGVLIEYPEAASNDDARRVDLARMHRPVVRQSSVRVGFIGAGSFALSTLLPAIKRTPGMELIIAASASGSHARHAAAKFGFRSCTTDEQEIINRPEVNTVVIATRHHLHAPQVIAALNAGKHVFCEKPLCLDEAELAMIADTYDHQEQPRLLMLGFNRRFAPFVLRMKAFLRDVHEPLALHYRINAGFLPSDHWLSDPQQGGGRIIAEVCHFVDLLSFLAGSAPVEVEARTLANSGRYSNDNVLCSLRFCNGSRGTISYLANGDRSFSKERIEVFGGGSVAVLEDFHRLELVRAGRKQILRSPFRRDKGRRGGWRAFVTAVQNAADSPIPFGEIVTTMLSTFALEESRCLGQPVTIEPLRRNCIKDAGGLDQASRTGAQKCPMRDLAI
jgi:predicted dehydrogenase/threonine dehydrogenase-like Zn-dependent dehydrogenase